LLGLCSVPATVMAGSKIRTVALVGQTAPGTNNIYTAFGAPSIDDAGHVSFFATLLHGGNPAFSEGIWSELNGTLTLMARRGVPPAGFPPGSGFSFQNSLLSSPPVAYDGGRVAIPGSVNSHAGIWFADGVSTSGAAVSGEAAPGTGAGTKFSGPVLTLHRVNAQGEISVPAALSAGSGDATSATDLGVWSGLPGSLQLLARQGYAVPGISGATFDQFTSNVLNDTGVTSFAATLSQGQGGVTSSNNSGIWHGTPGNLQLLVREGASAPGPIGEVFSEFRELAINNSGDFAFAAMTFPSNGAGLWRTDSGALGNVVYRGMPVPGASGDVRFRTVAAPVMNGPGAVAFTAYYEGSNVDDVGAPSIWVENAGQLQLVARVGDVVPGTNGTARFAGTISDDFLPILDNSGHIVFKSSITIEGVNGARDAIFVYDLAGQLLQSLKFGDLLEVAPGDFRVIEELSLAFGYDDVPRDRLSGSGGEDGRPNPLSDHNQLAFRARFGNFNEGVFLLTVPEPTGFTLGALAASIAFLAGIHRRRERGR